MKTCSGGVPLLRTHFLFGDKFPFYLLKIDDSVHESLTEVRSIVSS